MMNSSDWPAEELPFVRIATFWLWSLPIFFVAVFAGIIPDRMFVPVFLMILYGLVVAVVLWQIFSSSEKKPAWLNAGTVLLLVGVGETIVAYASFSAFQTDLAQLSTELNSELAAVRTAWLVLLIIFAFLSVLGTLMFFAKLKD